MYLSRVAYDPSVTLIRRDLAVSRWGTRTVSTPSARFASIWSASTSWGRAMCNIGGRERTASYYRRLLSEAEFEVTAGV